MLGEEKAAVDEGIVPEFIGIVANYCAIARIQLSSGIGNTIPAEEALRLYDEKDRSGHLPYA